MGHLQRTLAPHPQPLGARLFPQASTLVPTKPFLCGLRTATWFKGTREMPMPCALLPATRDPQQLLPLLISLLLCWAPGSACCLLQAPAPLIPSSCRPCFLSSATSIFAFPGAVNLPLSFSSRVTYLESLPGRSKAESGSPSLCSHSIGGCAFLCAGFVNSASGPETTSPSTAKAGRVWVLSKRWGRSVGSASF